MAGLPGVCVCGVVCAMLESIYLDGRCVKDTLPTWAPHRTSVPLCPLYLWLLLVLYVVRCVFLALKQPVESWKHHQGEQGAGPQTANDHGCKGFLHLSPGACGQRHR